MTQEAADEKFAKWIGEKESKVDQKRQNLSSAKTTESASRLEQETKVREARAEAARVKAQKELLDAEAAAKAAVAAATPEVVAPEAEATPEVSGEGGETPSES